jgi:hypothetical protein
MLMSLAPERLDTDKLPKCKEILAKIRHRAIEQWGEERWKIRLSEEYCKVRIKQGFPNATPVNCRPSIVWMMKSGKR